MQILLAQLTSDPISRELGRLQRNYEFLSYGLTVAWIVLVVYLLVMVSRQKKLKREIASLRAILEEKQR